MAKFEDTNKQFEAGGGPAPLLELSMAELSPPELHAAIHQVLPAEVGDPLPRIRLAGVAGQHHALMRLDHGVRIHLEGSLGHYPFAHNAQADLRLTGSAGHGVGEGMISGSVRVRGQVGDGAGAAMRGGMLTIYGSAGDRAGAAMRGGGVFIRGNVGDYAGIGALRGSIVIGGDAGEHVGSGMNRVTIMIRGQVKSLAPDAIEAPLRKREQLRLGLLLIQASIRGDAGDFRRIIPRWMWETEQRERGEVNPSWR